MGRRMIKMPATAQRNSNRAATRSRKEAKDCDRKAKALEAAGMHSSAARLRTAGRAKKAAADNRR